MKNIFLKFSFSLFTVFLLFSCKTNKVKNEENLVNFAHLTLDSLAHLDNDTAKQSCKITLNLEYPVDADNKVLLDTLIYDFVETIFGNQYTGKSFEDAAKAYIKTYIEDYQLISKELEKEDYELGASFNYEEKLVSEIYFNRSGFLCYFVNVYSYTGGAHSTGGTSCYSIDLNNYKYISIYDIFNDEYFSNISELIVAQILRDRDLKSSSQLAEEGFFSVEEIMPTDNFYFNTKGITWIYNPYQIAVYPLGEIKVTLSWKAIHEYLSETSPIYEFVKESLE